MTAARSCFVLVAIAGCAHGTPPDRGEVAQAVEGGRPHQEDVGALADHRDLHLASVFPTLLRAVGTPLDAATESDLAQVTAYLLAERSAPAFLPTLARNAVTIPAAVHEIFLRDDDDGDLSNQTPHWDVLIAAAERHDLSSAVEGDGGGDGGGRAA